MKPLPLFLLSLLLWPLLFSTGCSKGALLLQHSPNRDKEPATRIISIKPSFFLATNFRSRERQITRSENELDKFENSIIAAAKRAKIDLQLFSPTRLSPSDLDYFNDLIPLRNYLLIANDLQEVESEERKGDLARPNYLLFEDPIRIPPDFAWLAEKYDTPYFAIHGIASAKQIKLSRLWWLFLFPPFAVSAAIPKYDSLYYTLIVDVTRSEVVYREVRILSQPPSKTNLQSVVYDSFRLFQKP